ncbi:MAG TPA: LTA synthase family protein [Thermoanaerobaculia bacterium]|nr:LTA synthase family protein [Thermoanaerobaculia bacterium]
MLVLRLLFGVAARVRIAFGSAFPSTDVVRWFLLGLSFDVAGLGTVALLFYIASRWIAPKVVRAVFAVLTGVLCVLHIAMSEAIILFGSAVRPEDFEAGPVWTTFERSLRGYSGALLFIAIVFSIAGIFAARARAERLVLAPKLALIVLAAGLAIAIAPMNVHRRDSARGPLISLWVFSRDASSLHAAARMQIAPQPPMPPVRVRDLLGDDAEKRAFFSEEYPLAYRAGAAAPTAVAHPNIVFIAVESLRAIDVGAYGLTAVKNITPNIDALARDGIRIERAYSGGTYTPSGEVGMWYGQLPVPGTITMLQFPNTTMTGLPELLRPLGYRSFFWISSTDTKFFHREAFYRPRGFQMFDGSMFPASDLRINWGVSDRVLAHRAVEAISRLNEPFGAMVLTVDNHHPYQLPADAEPPLQGLPEPRGGYVPLVRGQLLGLHSSQMAQTIHYSDTAVGDFFRLARQQPWFARTIFVITGDHGIAVAPLGRTTRTTHQLAELRHRIPLILYSPLLLGGRVIAGPAGHVDLMPTLARLAGATTLTGVGRDLLSSDPDGERPLFSWSEHERMLSIWTSTLDYHCVIPPGLLTPEDEELIDRRTDRDGTINMAQSRPADLVRFRRWATTYVQLYSWLIARGRGGVPAGGTGAEANRSVAE